MRSLETQQSDERGMTLVEVLIAFLVAMIGIFGVFSVFPQTYQASRDSGRITVLNRLAAEKINRLRSLDPAHADLSSGVHPAQATDSDGDRYYPVPGWDEAFSLRWEVLGGPTDGLGNPEPDLKTIVVEATFRTRYQTSGTPVETARSLGVAFRTFVTE